MKEQLGQTRRVVQMEMGYEYAPHLAELQSGGEQLLGRADPTIHQIYVVVDNECNGRF